MSWYAAKQSDGDVPVKLKLWGMLSITSLPLLPGPFLHGVVAHNRVRLMGLIEMFNIQTECKLSLNTKLGAKWLILSWIVRNGIVWTFNSVLIHERCLIELLDTQSKNWNYLNLLTYLYKSNISKKKSKVGDRSRGRPEVSLFQIYYTEV